jgi:hypothetical protein
MTSFPRHERLCLLETDVTDRLDRIFYSLHAGGVGMGQGQRNSLATRGLQSSRHQATYKKYNDPLISRSRN